MAVIEIGLRDGKFVHVALFGHEALHRSPWYIIRGRVIAHSKLK